MTNGLSYPRIPTQVAIALLREFDGKDVEDIRSASGTDHLRAYFHPNYPCRVEVDRLERLRDGVEFISREHGYPRPLTSNRPASEFDREVATLLVENMDILPVEAAIEEVWNFFTLVLLPHVGVWRYPFKPGDHEYERLIGKPRNVFRKLWWRAYVLGPELSAILGEDSTVGIMERPSIGGNVELSRAIVRAYERVRSHPDGASFASEFLRVALVRIRTINAVRGLTFLPQELLQAEVDGVFNAVRDAFLNAAEGGRITSGRELRRRVSSGAYG